MQLARSGGGTVTFIGDNGVTTTRMMDGWTNNTYDLALDGLTAPVTVVMGTDVADSYGLTLQENDFEGMYPDLSGNPWMGAFSCVGNRLTGSIPPMSTMPGMAYLDLSRNQFSGTFPDLVGHTALISMSFSLNNITGPFPDLSTNVDLQTIYCYQNQMTGQVPPLTNNVNLQVLSAGGNQLTGDIPDLSNCTALREVYLDSNPVTGWAGGTLPATLVYLEMAYSSLTSAAVDGLLAALVAAGASNGWANFQGTSVPSAAGVADKDTLVSRGWTVTVDA
jgi:hypothetical protein